MAGKKFQWKNIKLKNKFLFIVIPSAIISSVIIFACSYFIFHEYEKSLYQSTIKNMNMLVKRIEIELGAIENLSDSIVTNADIQTALQKNGPNIRQKDVSSDYNRLAQSFYETLSNKLTSEKNVNSISVFVEKEWYRVNVDHTILNYNEALAERAEEVLQKTNGESVWYIDQYPTKRLYNVRKIKELYLSTFETLGILVIEYDIDATIQELISENGRQESAYYVNIYNSSGLLFSNMKDSKAGQWKDGQEYDIVSVKNDKYFASSLGDSNYGWQYVFYIPFNSVFGHVQILKMLFIILAIAIIVASAVFCNKLVSTITVHFDYLLRRMKSVKDGNLQIADLDIYLKREDEIGQICSNFELMVEELNSLIQDNYVKQMLIKENQLKVLKSQINPHFLFNTLHVINWKAKESCQQTISQITEALGKLLRYTLQDNNDPVSLKEELTILVNYITIQKFRYQERLQVKIIIPESLYVQQVPKLALQNVVENSIKYALENMLSPCKIRIWTEEQEHTYRIFVQDNGPGIDESIAEHYFDRVGRHGSQNGHQGGLGIGLANINSRIKLMFSEQYGITLHNTGKGTMVEFFLPKR